MNHDRFNILLEERIDKIRAILKSKAVEYATEDRFHNFKRAATILGESPEDALIGMFIKHLVSVLDIAQDTSIPAPPGMWDEKIGDAINYLILLDALYRERYQG